MLGLDRCGGVKLTEVDDLLGQPGMLFREGAAQQHRDAGVIAALKKETQAMATDEARRADQESRLLVRHRSDRHCTPARRRP